MRNSYIESCKAENLLAILFETFSLVTTPLKFIALFWDRTMANSLSSRNLSRFGHCHITKDEITKKSLPYKKIAQSAIKSKLTVFILTHLAARFYSSRSCSQAQDMAWNRFVREEWGGNN